MKRVSADDSAGSRVKVGHRQAIYSQKRPINRWGVFISADNRDDADKNEINCVLLDRDLKTVS